MPDIKKVLASEISRLAKKEIKTALKPLQAQLSALRKTLAAQNAKIKALEKRIPAAVASKPKTESQPATDRQVRITAESIAKLRRKLGLTQMQLAALLEVSNFSVSHWELGKTAPREDYKHKIAALRDMGKHELKRLLKAKGVTPTTEPTKVKPSSATPESSI
ncbi:MAG: helix-turn-helix domain-containing protein [Victivallaceae bacterium]|nr:helix-turn-helix domain-containing protein [Victivallaceae bacterium]